MVYTSSDILSSVKRNQSISTANFRFTDAALLSMVDEEIESTIIPTILRLKSDRLLFRKIVPLVAGQSNYSTPYRAVAGQLRDLVLQDALTNPTWKQPLNLYDFRDGNINTQSGSPTGFYLGDSDEIVLVPSVTTDVQTWYLSMSYPLQHPRLVTSAEVAVISSVNYTTGAVTLTASAPTDWSTASYLDFLVANDRSKPHLIEMDKNPLSIVTSTLTFTPADIPLGLVAGDKIALAQESDTLLLPNECYKYLCKAVEIKIMEAQKDLQAVQAAEVKLRASRMSMESILTPRTTGASKVIINRNGLMARSVRRGLGINREL